MTERPFNTRNPLTCLITWTCYGTWLPGDARGSWRRGGEWVPSNRLFRDISTAEMKETAFWMDETDRQVVEQTIGEHCRVRNWSLHARIARSNHVHVVVSSKHQHPNTARDQFKAWCTRRLKPTHPTRKRFWTEGGTCRWINHEDDLQAAVTYVSQAQDRKHLD